MTKKRKGFGREIPDDIAKEKDNTAQFIKMQLGLLENGEHEDSASNLKSLLKGKKIPYKEKYCTLLIYWMGQGHSFKSFGGLISVSGPILKSWVETYPEFAIALDIGESKRLARTESQFDGQALSGKAASLIFGAKNHHKNEYKDNEKDRKHGGPKIIILNTGIQRENKKIDVRPEYHKMESPKLKLPTDIVIDVLPKDNGLDDL